LPANAPDNACTATPLLSYAMNPNNQPDLDDLLRRYEQSLSDGRPVYYDVDELEVLSDYYWSNGKRFESSAVIDLGLKLHPNNSNLLLKRATLYVEIGDYKHALHILDRLPEKDDGDALLLRAEVYLRLECKQDGLDLIERIMQSERLDKVQRCLDVVAILSDMTWFPLAIDYLQDTLKQYPDNQELLEELAWCYEQVKDYVSCITVYNRMLDLDPYKADIWFNLGQCHFNREEYNKAVEAYEFALTIYPDDQIALLQLGHAHFQASRYKESAVVYEECVKQDPENDIIRVYLGEAYEKSGQLEKALPHYEQAWTLNPLNKDACVGMAVCLMEQKIFGESLTWLDRALKIDEEDPEVWVYLAELMQDLELREEAFMSYLRALSLDPGQPDVLASMGNLAFDDGNYAKALSLYEAARELDPALPGLNLFFALAYARLDQTEQAMKYLDKAVEADPKAIDLFREIMMEEGTEEGDKPSTNGLPEHND
jgi:tetratricopeptide (TPR) repeat protein